MGCGRPEKVIDGSRLQAGECCWACYPPAFIPTASLVRKVFGVNEENVNQYYSELGSTLGETLLTPTRIYVKPVLAAVEAADVKAISHITGGGFYENIPRMMREGLTARVEKLLFGASHLFLFCRRQEIFLRGICTTPLIWGVGLCMAVSPGNCAERS